MLRPREGGRTRRRVGAWMQVIPLVALWAIPVVAVVVAVPMASVREEVSLSPPLPAVVTVGSQSADYRTSVTVSVELERAGQVWSPVSGVLTSLAEWDGAVHSGQELFAVDGVPILAQRGTVPLHRELRLGDEGEDVKALARFLADAGMLDRGVADVTFGSDVHAAVMLLQEKLGVRADGVFRPAYVAFVPQYAYVREEALLTVGSPIAVGEAVLDMAPAPARVGFTPTSSGSLVHLQSAPVIVIFGDLEIPVSGLKPNSKELAKIHAGLREAVAAGEAEITSGEPGQPERYEGGILRIAEPQVRGVVPGSAVHVTALGAQCLFRQHKGGWSPEPLTALEPVVGTLGAVYVDAELIGARIARDPLALADDTLSECK